MIIRSKHDKRNPYLTISMKILRDRRLTSEERDCLIMMLSNTDNWEFSYKGLAAQLGLKRETVKARVQSLIEKGYVSVSYPIGENGKPLPFAKGDWVIREEPIISDQGTKKHAQQCPIPGHQKTGTAVSDSWAPDSGHQGLDTKAWTPDVGHQDLDTNERAQRITSGVELPTANYQDEDYQVEEYQSYTTTTNNAEVVVEDEAESLPPYNASSFKEIRSEANASPLSGKTSSGQQVMTQREFEFQQFLKKYPKAPLNREMEDTRKAFFEATDLDGSFAEIMAGLDDWYGSAEWRRDNGRWIKKPMNWLKERKWKPTEDLLSAARKRQLDELFPTEEALI